MKANGKAVWSTLAIWCNLNRSCGPCHKLLLSNLAVKFLDGCFLFSWLSLSCVGWASQTDPVAMFKELEESIRLN